MIFIIIFLIGLIVVINALYFILPSLSPIPFFPTNKKDLPMIVETLLNNVNKVTKSADDHFERLWEIPTKSGRVPTEAKNVSSSATIIDLGAGTGTVLFAAAQEAYKKKLDLKFIAIDIHPLLITILFIKSFFHPNKKNIVIIRGDIFRMNYQELLLKYRQNITIYLYVGPFVMDRIKEKLNEFTFPTRVVSYMYKIPGWGKKLADEKHGVHDLFTYIIDK